MMATFIASRTRKGGQTWQGPGRSPESGNVNASL